MMRLYFFLFAFSLLVCGCTTLQNDAGAQPRPEDSRGIDSETTDAPANEISSLSLTSCGRHFQNTPPRKTEQNNDSSNILNYSWKVHSSKAKPFPRLGQPAVNCSKRECLCKGDLFKIIGPENPAPNTAPPLTLTIVSQADAAIYHFDSMSSSLSDTIDPKDGSVDQVEMKFIDDVEEVKECRLLTVDLVRSSERQGGRPNGCKDFLDKATRLGEQEKNAACNFNDLVVWDIKELPRIECNLPPLAEQGEEGPVVAITMNVPEPGQGTASGID